VRRDELPENSSETNKEALEKFLQIPEVKLWYNGVGTQLKDSTRNEYAGHLMKFFEKEPPADFMKRAQQNPRETAIEVKGRLGELYKHSMNAAHLTKYALRTFLEFHEIEMRVNGKIKVRRTRQKPELEWENADSIILETDEPYRSIFSFMKWSGLGEDEFMEIQNSPEIQRKIEAQRTNDRSYVKIALSPRKSTLDEFFTLVPKKYVPKFPLKTKVHENRGGSLVDPHDMQQVWRRAAKKAKLWQEGLGPHTLRSTFRSQCGKLGVPIAVAEFCMGHGGGDKYGYSREVLNEGYMVKELRKLWEQMKPASETEVKGLQEQIKRLQEDRKLLFEARLRELDQQEQDRLEEIMQEEGAKKTDGKRTFSLTLTMKQLSKLEAVGKDREIKRIRKEKEELRKQLDIS
jgi:hypothetical protein